MRIKGLDSLCSVNDSQADEGKLKEGKTDGEPRLDFGAPDEDPAAD